MSRSAPPWPSCAKPGRRFSPTHCTRCWAECRTSSAAKPRYSISRNWANYPAGLLSLLRRFQLQPIGVRNLHPDHTAQARKAGLAILDGIDVDERNASIPPPAAAPAPQVEPRQSPMAPSANTQAGTMFVDRPVRSGQQVYARGGDLVLLAGMSNGAEIIADGSIHCYGPLRGRALAGAQGNASARIISTNFGPEIVSIAGVYKTFEQGIPAAIAGKPATVRLVGSATDQKLGIEPLPLD